MPLKAHKPVLLLHPRWLATTRRVYSDTSRAPFTAAQTSRTSANRVRTALADGNYGKAEHYVSALRFAPTLTQPNIIIHRLPAHALLHGYLRSKKFAMAKMELDQMMHEGLRIPATTLDAVFASLIAQVPEEAQPLQEERTRNSPLVLQLRDNMVTDPNAGYALSFILRLRRHMYPRSLHMYRSLVAVLLIQKEYVAAALLFELMVKDYHLLNALHSEISSQNSPISPDGEDLQARYRHLKSENIFPSRQILTTLSGAIKFQLWQKDTAPASLQSASQALAILGTLLDRQLLPFPDVRKLIEALFMCDGNDCSIYIADQPEPRPIYSYAKQVLRSVVNNLPSTEVPSIITNRRKMPKMRPLTCTFDLPTYNILIQLLLRVWYSPLLARKVFLHMIQDRKDPLCPDENTFKILTSREDTLMTMKLDPELVAQLTEEFGASPGETYEDDRFSHSRDFVGKRQRWRRWRPWPKPQPIVEQTSVDSGE